MADSIMNKRHAKFLLYKSHCIKDKKYDSDKPDISNDAIIHSTNTGSGGTLNNWKVWRQLDFMNSNCFLIGFTNVVQKKGFDSSYGNTYNIIVIFGKKKRGHGYFRCYNNYKVSLMS